MKRCKSHKRFEKNTQVRALQNTIFSTFYDFLTKMSLCKKTPLIKRRKQKITKMTMWGLPQHPNASFQKAKTIYVNIYKFDVLHISCDTN